MGQILLVRHGQARFAHDDYDQLSDLGREQARLLGAWLARQGRGVDAAVSGTMKRHTETAQACLAELPDRLRPPAECRVDGGFDEYDSDHVVLCHRPEFANAAAIRQHVRGSDNPRRTFQDLFAGAMARWMGGDHDADYREPWQAFRDRCVSALKGVVQGAGRSQRLMVFTSGGPIAAICQHILGLDSERTLAVNTVLVNCATTGLLYQPERVTLSHLNNFAHLEESGDSRMVTYR